MKRTIVLFCLLLGVIPFFAQNAVVIHQKDGQKCGFGFEDKPVITYTDTHLVLKTTNTEVQYPLTSLDKITFSDVENAVQPIQESDMSPEITLDKFEVCISGAKPKTIVSFIDSGGKTLNTFQTDSDGKITFSIDELPQGVYIIKSDNLTFKILKK